MTKLTRLQNQYSLNTTQLLELKRCMCAEEDYILPDGSTITQWVQHSDGVVLEELMLPVTPQNQVERNELLKEIRNV